MIMKKTVYVILIALIVQVFLLMPEVYAQCAMCKAVAESSSGQVGAKNLNFGILFLMSVPYVLVSIIAFAMWRHYKVSKKSL